MTSYAARWIDASLSYTRRYFWEQDIAESDDGTEPLNLKSSEDTGGAEMVDVYNNDDATPAATNYVLALTPVSPPGDNGVVPAPMRLHIVKPRPAPRSNGGTSTCAIGSRIRATVVDPFLLGSEAVGGASYALTTTENDGWRWTDTVLNSTRCRTIGRQALSHPGGV